MIIPEAPPAALDVEAEALAPEQLLNAAGAAEETAAAAAAAAAASSSSAAVAFEGASLSSSPSSAVFAPPSSSSSGEAASGSPPAPPPSPPRPPPRDPLRALRWLASRLSPDKGAPAPSASSSPLSSSAATAASDAAPASSLPPPTSFSTVTFSTDSDDEGIAAAAAAAAATAAAAAAAAAATADPVLSFAPVDFEAAAAFGGVTTAEASPSLSAAATDAAGDGSPPFSTAAAAASLPLGEVVATPPPIAEAPDVPIPAATAAATAAVVAAGSSSAAAATSSAFVAGKSNGAAGAAKTSGGGGPSRSKGAAATSKDSSSSGGGGGNDPRESPDLGNVWGLGVLGLLYVHHSTTGFALPALLPLISPDLALTDVQGSLLTAGYTVLYALALIPVGFLADRADRPRMLAGGAALWSLATVAASRAQGFGELLALRVGFAAAQATQNPICFSLIPELFPRERNTAMAAYNAAIYVGRALSFAAVIVAGRLGMGNVSANSGAAGGGADGAAGAVGDVAGSIARDIGVTMVPLDKLDLSQVSLLYTQGERRKEKRERRGRESFFSRGDEKFLKKTHVFFPKNKKHKKKRT